MIKRGGFGLIQQLGVGVDGIDVATATEQGVWVTRLPGALTGNADSVAELAVAHVLALLRRTDEARAALRERRWGQPIGRSLVGATVLLIGLGATGTALVERLRGFKPRILVVRAHPERGGVEGVEAVFGTDQLGELAREADVIICCAVLDEGSRQLLNAEVFGRVRAGAVFVNVARGGLVDETALLEALNSGRLAGAALDVFATEPADPDRDRALLGHPHLIATPHIAGYTTHMFLGSIRLFADNLRQWAAGEAPRWSVNTPLTPRHR